MEHASLGRCKCKRPSTVAQDRCGSLGAVAEDVHFTAKLPTKRMAADCPLFDDAGRLLILEPTYKETWEIPGGVVEADESPRAAAQREVREEIGLEVEPGALLAVDWQAAHGEYSEIVAILFDGGVLTPRDIAQIELQQSEVRSASFVTLPGADALLDTELAARVRAGVAARRHQSAVYLEDGLTAT